MISKGIATFTLDYGKCPPWLFERMVKLGREMIRVMVAEEGPNEVVRRLGDPVWFQSLGTVLAFDWNASGLTTILTAALKEAIRGEEKELGLFMCGGKGKTSLKTPEEIERWSWGGVLSQVNAQKLIYNSKMAAKVDSSLLQDGFQIYHHAFIFSKNGAWTVVQQGMNTQNQTARRYHWHSAQVTDMVCEPHSGIASQTLADQVLDLAAAQSAQTRDVSTQLVNQNSYAALMKDVKILRRHMSTLSRMVEVEQGQQRLKLIELEDVEFKTHPVLIEDFSKSAYLEKILWKVTDRKPKDYEELLSLEGVGPKTMRALALVGEVLYGARPSYEDPARFSFAHGGKDATPYPIDKPTYDITIETLKRYTQKTRLEATEKANIIKRLDNAQRKNKARTKAVL